MRHTFFSISLASLIMLSISGCTEIFRHDGTEEGLKITISCGPQTKATQDGVGNENLIKTVDVFLFPDVEGADGKYTTRFHEEPEISTNFTMYIGSAFAREAKYTVFTIVNYPYSSLSDLDTDFGVNSDPQTRKTLAELQALALSESSHRTFTGIRFGDKIYPANEEDLALVMTGQTSVTINTASGSNIVGEADIDLTRLAAKVTMDIFLQDELDVKGDGSEIWTPIIDGSAIRAYLCNGNESITLGGNDPTDPSVVPTVNTAALFDYEPNTEITGRTGKTGFSAAYTIPAFYTYPETWTEGDANEPYIKLIVQWQLARTTSAGTFTSQKETYYKVKLPISASTGFESNHWYNLQLDVTQLGGSSQNEAVPIIPSYQVANWGSTSFMLSTLIRSYYLGIAEANKNLKIYTDKVEIPFTSSGNVSFTTTIESIDFFLNTTVTHDNDTGKWVSIDNVNDILTINRPIRENFPIEYDVSPYDFSITLHLVDELGTTDFDQVVHVTQYPPLYLSSQDTKVGISNGDRNKKPTVIINNTKPDPDGSIDVWDNAVTTTTKSVANHSHYLGTIAVPTAVLSASSNNSPYLYTVTATNIDLKVSYDGDLFDAVIGDPRGNPVNYDSDSGEKLSGGYESNVLTNYRPTNGNSKNIIAPQFMCASSYGKTSAVSYEGAVKRCAAYQEYGYPAGRWRLPTAAEVAFLQELNADSKIPSMFAASSTGSQILGYWTAGKELYTTEGFVNLTDAALVLASNAYQYTISGATKPYRGFVRCVYDTWYWGDTKSATTNSEWLKYKPNLSDTF